MRPTPGKSQRDQRALRPLRMGTAGLLCLALAGLGGCAVLVPPPWRSSIDLPLQGPLGLLDAEDEEVEEAIADALALDGPARGARIREIRRAIARDRARLTAMTSDDGRPPMAEVGEDSELREIAHRLPRLQAELEVLDPVRPGRRIQHPVIR